VHGRFHRFEGELQLGAGGGGCAALCIDAASVDTGNRRRDRHLRSPDYFDCVRHPFLRFAGSVAPTPGAGLKLRGGLEAAGRTVPLDLVATVEGGGDQLTLVAGANVDARELDMSWSPVGALRTPVELTVHACLRRAD
jgi:polyisoprenoid-binding protein YceI